jgi:peptide/nickel transport system substrate-binding protein
MRKLSIFTLAAAVLAFGLVAGAFANGTGESASAQQQTLVYATTDKVTQMDPANAYDFHTWEIFQNIDRGLLTYKPGTTDIVPGLAESYTVNDKGDQYTFKLRKGLKFSNGDPFNAQVVKWSIDRVMKLNGDPAWLVTSFVKSVDVIDDNTVRFNLVGPTGYFPALIATPPYFPLDPKNYPADKIIKSVSELNGGAIAGLGPYNLTSFKRDEEAVFTANPNYYGTKPNINQIIIRYFADATTMRLALESGEVDLVYKTLNPSDIKDLEANPKFTTNKLSGPYIRYVCFETSESVFKDKRLREAFAALINRPEINQKVYLGQNEPLYSMIPKGMIYHTDDFKSALGDGNIQLAQKLLTQAGYSKDKPFTFDLWYTPSHYGDTEVNLAQVLKNELEASGMMKVTLKSAEWATYKQQYHNKQMPVFLLGWYPDYVDPDDYTAAFASTAGSKGSGIYFSNPKWDALFTKEQQSTDPKVREQVFTELQKMWTDQVPTAPIYQGNLYVFTKPNVKGVTIGPTLIFNYDQLYFSK